MSKNFSDDEIKAALADCFNSIDSDRSGQLDSNEIYSVLLQFNKSSCCKEKMSESQIQSHVSTFIKEVDKNSDNKISKDEFINFFLPLCKD